MTVATGGRRWLPKALTGPSPTPGYTTRRSRATPGPYRGAAIASRTTTLQHPAQGTQLNSGFHGSQINHPLSLPPAQPGLRTVNGAGGSMTDAAVTHQPHADLFINVLTAGAPTPKSHAPAVLNRATAHAHLSTNHRSHRPTSAVCDARQHLPRMTLDRTE